MFDLMKRWAKTEHELCQENLSAFLDGQVTHRERMRVQKHLEECAACRADLEALRHTVALLRAVPAVKPPRSFLLPAREVIQQRQAQRRRLAYVYMQAATAVATVLLVLVVSGDAVLRYLPISPAARISEIRPAATAVLMEPGAVLETEGAPAPVPAPQESPAEPLGAGETIEITAVPQQSPEAPTTEAPVESLDATAAEQTKTTQIVVEKPVGELKAMPSETFASSAAPPAPPTLAAEARPVGPSPTAEAMAAAAPTVTPLPAPTDTPVPPTATPLSVPTNTPVPPTATSLPTSTAVPSMPTELPSPPPASGLWAFWKALRPFLPWIELTLALTVALLLALTLWLRRRQRLV